MILLSVAGYLFRLLSPAYRERLVENNMICELNSKLLTDGDMTFRKGPLPVMDLYDKDI